MSDSLSNKELVTVGHQFAKAMSSDTPIMDMAKMFTRLAERLDCTTAALREMTKHRDALAVENAAQGNALKELRSIAFNARRNSHNCGPFQYSDLCESIIDESKPEFPATDAFLAEVQAQGVEMLAAEYESKIEPYKTHDEFMSAHYLKMQANEARQFAAQLRQGAAQ